MTKKNNLKKLLDDASRSATHIVSNTDTIKKLKSKGLPIKERLITYEEYFEKLIAEKRKYAVPLLYQLPKIDDSIANSVISAVYEEVRASFGLGIFTSTIFNSIILLEFAMRTRVFDERLKNNPNSNWEYVEKLNMRSLIAELKKLGIIDNEEKLVLNDFNENFRNPYLHINIHKMIKGIYAKGVKKVDIKTPKVTVENQLDISKHRHLWFLAKKFYDKSYVLYVLKFCIHWTNRLLKKTENDS